MHFALVVQYQIDSTKPSGLLSWEPDHSGHCPGPVCTSRVRGKASLQRHSLPKSSLLIFFICPLKSHLQALATRVLRVGHTEARREGKQKGKSECMGGGGCCQVVMLPPWAFQGHCMTTLDQPSSKPLFFREMFAHTIILLQITISLTWEKKMVLETSPLGKLAAVTISSHCLKDFCGALGVGGQGIESHFISTCGSWDTTGKQMSTVLLLTFYNSQENHSGPFYQIYLTRLQ